MGLASDPRLYPAVHEQVRPRWRVVVRCSGRRKPGPTPSACRGGLSLALLALTFPPCPLSPLPQLDQAARERPALRPVVRPDDHPRRGHWCVALQTGANYSAPRLHSSPSTDTPHHPNNRPDVRLHSENSVKEHRDVAGKLQARAGGGKGNAEEAGPAAAVRCCGAWAAVPFPRAASPRLAAPPTFSLLFSPASTLQSTLP